MLQKKNIQTFWPIQQKPTENDTYGPRHKMV